MAERHRVLEAIVSLSPINRRQFLVTTGASAHSVADLSGSPKAARQFEPIAVPAWVHGVTRMAFLTPGQVKEAAEINVQVVHCNLVWPYFPLKKDGGGLSRDDDVALHRFVEECHRFKLRLVLGLPPFPPVELVKKHPEWRVDSDGSGKVRSMPPEEKNLGTRLCCNLGPWGDYLIEVCAELVERYDLDGYSFDGNYHPPLCHCPTCKASFTQDVGRNLPARVNLDDVRYREYLVWRGTKLENHYRSMQERLKTIEPDAVLMSWTVNAGRFGHFLHSPRAMPTRLNLLFDLSMQEWWLDEVNLGGSIMPAFGASYLSGICGGRPNASEPYLMSRGNPYGNDSFPLHERRTRALLSLTHGSLAPQSLGWSGGVPGAKTILDDLRHREPWITGLRRWPWAALLVSEQTRQFHAYKDIRERFLAYPLGAFRACMEEHIPVSLINDWDLTEAGLAPYKVLVLPGSAAISDFALEQIRAFVKKGGGLIASGDASICDELGRPRDDFGLADVFGVSFRGRPAAPQDRPPRDENFSVTIDEDYWKHRSGLADLTWKDHELVRDERLRELVPRSHVKFRGPLTLVAEPENPAEVVVHMLPDGWKKAAPPAIVARNFGRGKVVYCAAAIDAALWSYAYPYQRRLFARAIAWTAGRPCPIRVVAPMCVMATFWMREAEGQKQFVVQLFNNLDTTAGHDLPGMHVPLREEIVPVSGIQIQFSESSPKRFRMEPGGKNLETRREGSTTVVDLPPLDLHAMLVGEF